jgi:Ca2+-binding EF-hand superfamily protein
MIDKKFYIIAIILTLATVLTFAYSAFSQPPRPQKDGMGWFQRIDANNNGNIEAEEYKTFTAEIFKNLDRNNDGVIDDTERPRNPMPRDGQRPGQFPPVPGDNPQMQRPENQKPPIPFFVMESIKEPGDVSRAEFDESVMQQFKLMDKNGDGVVNLDEARSRFAEVDERVKNERRPEDFRPLDSPTAQFIAAEMRFGDKLIASAPFSAEIVIEDTRRLFDGSTVTKQIKGAVYRDKEGRTRREQPIDNIGGFPVVSENGSPQKLVFINDFVGKTHYFLDLNRKVARKNPLPDNRPQLAEKEPKDMKTESLGTKMMEGVSVEGTRTTFEIPAGQIGNDKPMQVVTEKWFSPELQVVVYSRHVDPIAGEHIFRLVNIKKSEPSADLFIVPNDFKIENPPRPDSKRNEKEF